MPTIVSTPLITTAFALALTLPSLAAAAPAPAAAPAAEAAATNAAIVAAAKASPLFKREVNRKGLRRAGLAKIRVRTGVDMDFEKYVGDTGLDRQERTAPLFEASLRPQWLAAAPTYRESIIVLSDRLVIDRTLTVPLLPGACDDAAAPKAISELCFVKDPTNKPSKAVASDLKSIRAALLKADPGRIVRGTVTAKQALDMSNEQLLALLLNGDERTIHHVSVVPRVETVVGPSGKLGMLDTALVPSAAASGLVEEVTIVKPHAGAIDVASAKDFATKYFLTGFTYGRQMEDAWEYTIANSTWLTDRYYLRLAYHVSFGFGVRAPFSVGVRSSGSGNTRHVDVTALPVNVDEQGNPAYAAVGLPANKTFEGKEFVLEFKAGCSFYASIPGPNYSKSCPSIDKGYSRDVDPVIGTESSQIHDWWLDGTITGLALDFAVVKATIDVGVGADVTNGRIRLHAGGINGASVSGLNNGALSFTNRNALGFDVTRPAGTTTGALKLELPRYGFDLRLRPKLRAKIDVDVAIYENQWIIGPYALDFLAVAQNFQLDRHDGTVASHDFAVFDNGLVVAPSDPVTPPPSKKPPVGKIPGVNPGAMQLD